MKKNKNNNVEIWKNVVLDNNKIPYKIKQKIQSIYQVSNLGRIKNIKTNRILKGYITESGYNRIDLCYNSFRYSFLIHRLVCLAFIQIDDKIQCQTVHHIDNNKLNNNLNNLIFIDRSTHSKITGEKYKRDKLSKSEEYNSKKMCQQ